MKIKVFGNQMAVISSVKKVDLEKLSAVNRKALDLLDENGAVEFSFAVGETGSVSKYGIIFDIASATGEACTVVNIEGEYENGVTKDDVVAKYGNLIRNANILEGNIKTALEDINGNLEMLKNSIEIGL